MSVSNLILHSFSTDADGSGTIDYDELLYGLRVSSTVLFILRHL